MMTALGIDRARGGVARRWSQLGFTGWRREFDGGRAALGDDAVRTGKPWLLWVLGFAGTIDGAGDELKLEL
ncbi:hypothetical protein M0R45_036075 [Rubus argutus]|uniref:Uncharacterized protein n=1 Tax=Rubus argutus TaxID=59490 RepID=A0AAW1W002_RUBAR